MAKSSMEMLPMPELLDTVKIFGLAEFYLSRSLTDKKKIAHYSRYLVSSPEQSRSCPRDSCDKFLVTNGAQFLWATAANAIPDQELYLAEDLLLKALSIANELEDIAWIHANLAQVYYDLHKTDPDAARKSIQHCRQLIGLGYMSRWAENMMQELAVMQVGV